MNYKVNHIIWMLANAIQNISKVEDEPKNEIQMEWLEEAIDSMEIAIKNAKELLPF